MQSLSTKFTRIQLHSAVCTLEQNIDQFLFFLSNTVAAYMTSSLIYTAPSELPVTAVCNDHAPVGSFFCAAASLNGRRRSGVRFPSSSTLCAVGFDDSLRRPEARFRRVFYASVKSAPNSGGEFRRFDNTSLGGRKNKQYIPVECGLEEFHTQ